jgi:transposase-like protein
MTYEKLGLTDFFARFSSEEEARRFLWRAKYGGKDFVCPRCTHEGFYQLHTRPEIRHCKLCDKQVRLRVGTILQSSKTAVLTWLRAIFLVTQDKRGISALHLKRELGMKSYDTVWVMLHKIREALRQRDERYKLSNVIELDGADLRHQAAKGEAEILVAIETKQWVDERGRTKERAGFAKVVVSRESKIRAQQFVDKAIEPGAHVNTDGSDSLKNLKNVDVDYQEMLGLPEALDRWLPWVHRFIANLKRWLMGTYHGVGASHLTRYLAEYIYRFNRRHDLNGLFHRAAVACATAAPVTSHALLG